MKFDRKLACSLLAFSALSLFVAVHGIHVDLHMKALEIGGWGGD